MKSLSIPSNVEMTLQVKESGWILWILVPILLVLFAAAVVGLPLFQDGSSYLLEMLINHSAVRHGRVSILLFQSPTIFLIKIFHRWGADPLETLPLVRLAFNLNYALVPLVSLFLSWLVIRRRGEGLFIWTSLVVLFVNLVNFSQVSELLIAVQLSWPLLLALIQDPKSKTFWILFLFLTPFFFFLHPLVVTIYLALAAVSAYIMYRQPVNRRAAGSILIWFLLAALLRVIYSYFTLSLYEVSFAATEEVSDYLTVTRWENIVFLATAVEIGLLVLLSHLLARSRQLTNAVIGLVLFQASVLLLFAISSLLHVQLTPFSVGAYIAAAALLSLWSIGRETLKPDLRSLYLGYAALSLMAGFFLMTQYASGERGFTLKTGLALFAALGIMFVAALDSGQSRTPDEDRWRFGLAVTLALIFSGVMVAKSIMWQTSVTALQQTLARAERSCMEMTSPEFRWLSKSPYNMINNWSLPSLALVVQDEQPRKAVLAQNDCQVLYDSGMIQVDPWSRFSKEFIVPPLEPE